MKVNSVLSDAIWFQLRLVSDERLRQIAKWGQQDYLDFKWIAVLSEEVGEAAQEVLKLEGDIQSCDRTLIKTRLLALREELIQVAAVAVAHAEKVTERLNRL